MTNGSTWPVAVLTSPYCPDFDPQRLAMAMCVGYFGSTGTREVPGIFSVSGFVSSKTRWREFETRWSKVLRQEGVNAFHARDFVQGSGEFATEVVTAPQRRSLLNALGRTVEQHILRAFSQSVSLDLFKAVDGDYMLTEAASGPYGLCAALLMASVRQWMATKYSDHLTLFVFQQGHIEQDELSRILKAVSASRGEPAQLWPSQWTDERGRRRYLRPLEAAELFAADPEGLFAHRLAEHSLLESRSVDRAQLLRICQVLNVPAREPVSARDHRLATG